MKERPILFSAPMVRAILDGTKTQTRRIVKPQFTPDAVPAEMSAETAEGWQTSGHSGLWWCDAGGAAEDAIRCPYGIPSDRLWVRETFWAFGRWETRFSPKKDRDEWHFIDMTLECDRVYQHAADTPDLPPSTSRGTLPGWWKRPAIFMPRAASRIRPEVTGIRVERLHDISEADAKAEGCSPLVWDGTSGPADLIDWPLKSVERPYGNDYALLWESLNGADSWDANPWVWVIEFKRVAP